MSRSPIAQRLVVAIAIWRQSLSATAARNIQAVIGRLTKRGLL